MPRISASIGWDGSDWRKPQSGDLLFDAKDFCKKAIRSPKRAVQARYGRASLLLGVAAIEAISNDALASIYELLMDAWPSECIGSPPWVYFKRLSHRPIERLLFRNRSIKTKLLYIFRLLRHFSTTPDKELDALEKSLKRAIQSRNRIVHMSYLLTPRKHGPVLNPRQIVPVAKLALEAAERYVDEVGYTFEELNLPVSTILDSSFRPTWWKEEEWE
jgi:hypothetical protein